MNPKKDPETRARVVGALEVQIESNISTIASRINEQHALAFGKAREALEHARQAGLLLMSAKAAVKHGEWLPWIAANMKFSVSTAQGYMRLADRWDELAKNANVAHLTLRDALDCLAEPKAIQRTTEQDEEKDFVERCRRDGIKTNADYDRMMMIKCRLAVVALENIQLALSEVSLLPPEFIDDAKESTQTCVKYVTKMLDRTTDVTFGALLLKLSRSLADLLKGLNAVKT